MEISNSIGGKPVLIGTHDGKFHADEVVGCVLLKQLPEYKNAEIVRSRNMEVLNSCDVVIDVGAEYNHSKKRYDHHQKWFAETLKSVIGVDEKIKLSSAGLVYAHYGKDIINEMTENSLTVEDAHRVFRHLYCMFIKEIDARDNGIDISDSLCRYKISTDLSSRVQRLNTNIYSSPNFDETAQFMKAYEMAGKEFRECLDYTVKHWLPSRNAVSEALSDCANVHHSQRIIKFSVSNVSWQSHLKILEDEKNIILDIFFVLFPDQKDGWRVQAVSRDGNFELRQQILPECTGLRGKELVAECGVEDAVFVHSSGFIGGARSYEGALQMAVKSIPFL